MSTRRAVPYVVTAAAALAAVLWAGCGPSEDAGGGPGARPRDAASSGHPAVPTDRAASPAGFRSHVEFTPEGAVDWGNLRLVVRVVVPLTVEEAERLRSGPPPVESPCFALARAEAERTAATVAAGVRVDSRDTLANLVTDAGALRRWMAEGLRPLARRLLPAARSALRRAQDGRAASSGRGLTELAEVRPELPAAAGKHRGSPAGAGATGELEEVYELPLTGAGGIIDRLYERASRTADVPVRSAPGPVGPASAEASSGSAPVPLVTRALPAAMESTWGIDWTLRFFKGMAAVTASPGDVTRLAPVVVIDARGTGLAPALFPAVLNETGEPVYSAAVPRRERVVREGLVQYIELGPGADLAELAGLPGLRPQVIVKAVAAEGPLRANVVLDAEGARRLRAEKEALEEARVVVVVGEP